MKQVAVRLALTATFKKLDLDSLDVIRGAPNGSVRNKIERFMSLFNLPLSHMSIKRAPMSDWAEEEAKNCASVKDV